MENSFENFSALWEWLLSERRDADAIKIPGREPGTYVNFRVTSLGTRAARLAEALRGELALEPGDAVAVLADAPQEFPLIFHGAMLASVVVVPLHGVMPDDLVVSLLNNASVKVVIFPPEAAARISGLFARTPYVAHWVVTGSGMRLGAGAPIKRLDDIMSSGAGMRAALPPVIDGDVPALIVVSPESGKGVKFSQRAVLAAGAAMAGLVVREAEERVTTVSFLSNRTVVGLVHDLVQGLFSGVPAVVAPDFDAGKFWDTVMVTGARTALVTLQQLRQVVRRGRMRGQAVPQGVRLIVVANRTVPPTLLDSFEKRFGFSPMITYSLTEAGGIVAAFPQDLDPVERARLQLEREVPSSGIALAGISWRVVDPQGEDVPEGQNGEVLVQGTTTMSSYAGTENGACFFGLENFMHTGDEGCVVLDASSRRHLVVAGRIAEMVDIEGERVNPLQIENILLELRGVESAVVVPVTTFGGDVRLGAYVVQSRMSAITEEQLINDLRGQCSEAHLPTVVEIVTSEGRPDTHSRGEIRQRLQGRLRKR